MPRDACINLLVNEYGISTEKSKRILDAIDTEKMRIESVEGLADIEPKLEKAIRDNAKKSQLNVLRSKKRAALNLRSTAKILDELEQRYKANPDMDASRIVEAQIVGFEKTPYSRSSVDLSARGYSHRQLGRLEEDFKKADIPASLLEEKSFSKSVTEVLLGGSTDRKGATRAAEIIRKHMDELFMQASKSGVDLRYLSEYVPQSWDAVKLGQVNVDDFVNDVVKVMDLSGWENPEKKLRKIFFDIQRGGKIEDLVDAGKPKIGSDLLGSISRERVINIRNPESWLQIAEKYGNPNGVSSSMQYIERMSHRIGMIQSAGLNAERNIVKASNLFLAAHPEIKGFSKLHDVVNGRIDFSPSSKLKGLWSNVDLSVHNPVNPSGFVYRAAAFAQWLQSVSRLGAAPLSAISDIYISASTLSYRGTNILSAYGRVLSGIFKRSARVSGRGIEDVYSRSVANYVGVYAENVGADIVNRFDVLYGMPGSLNKLQNKFFKWSGLTPWTNHLRSNVASILSYDFAKKVKKGWNRLPPKFKRLLKQHNVSKAEFESLSRNMIQADNKKWFMNFDTIEDLTLRNKMYNFFVDEVEAGVIKPDAATAYYLNWGTQSGTVIGSILRLATQFKSFPITFGRKHLMPALREAGTGQMGYITNLLVGSMVWGYLSMTAKDIVKGRSPRPLDRWETFASAFAQGGGLGIYGDFFLAKSNRFGNNFLETLAGPTIGDVAKVTNWMSGTLSGEPPSLHEMTKFSIDHMPFINLWYTRGAMNHLFLNGLYESLDPGYLRRVEKYKQKEHGNVPLL